MMTVLPQVKPSETALPGSGQVGEDVSPALDGRGYCGKGTGIGIDLYDARTRLLARCRRNRSRSSNSRHCATIARDI